MAVVILVAFFAIVYAIRQSAPVVSEPKRTATTTEQGGTRVMSIESYVTQNISELSPIKAPVGGTYYVTEIEADEGKGVVKYEDGHYAFVADFTYSLDVDTGITINSFVIRP